MNVIRLLMDRARPAVRLRRRLFGPARPRWSEEFETIATVLRSSSTLSTFLPLSWQRKIIEPGRPPTAAMRATETHRAHVGGVPCVRFERDGQPRDRLLVYFHGGGYSIGSIRSHEDLISRLCGATGLPVLAPVYRLAPEHPFPAQLEDARAVYDAVVGSGIEPSRIVLAGESAGGGLVLSTLLSLRDEGAPPPACGVLISPWVDLEASGSSVEENAPWDFVSRKGLLVYAKRFVQEHELRHPMASPIHADLDGLPPLLVQVGEAEALRDDGIRLARRARERGVDVQLEVWPDMIHAFHVFAPILADAREAIDHIGDFVREHDGRS